MRMMLTAQPLKMSWMKPRTTRNKCDPNRLFQMKNKYNFWLIFQVFVNVLVSFLIVTVLSVSKTHARKNENTLVL